MSRQPDNGLPPSIPPETVITHVSYEATAILKLIHKQICEEGFFYFDPEHIDIDYAGAKTHVFWNENSWCIAFETISFNYSGSGINADLFPFGQGVNAPTFNTASVNFNSHAISGHDNFMKVFGEDMDSIATKDEQIYLNGKGFEIPSELAIKKYLSGVDKTYNLTKIGPTEVLRYLIDHHPNDIFLDIETIKQKLGISMERKLLIQEWHHEYFSCYNGESGISPSQLQMLKMASKAIEARDSTIFLAEKGNTHWKHYIHSPF